MEQTLEEIYGDRIKTNDDRSVTWALLAPIQGRDGMIDSITLQRPKAKVLRQARGATDADRAMWTLAQLSGIEPPFLDELDGEDFVVLGRIVARFLGNSLPTGGA
jgi:hypothetical protein